MFVYIHFCGLMPDRVQAQERSRSRSRTRTPTQLKAEPGGEDDDMPPPMPRSCPKPQARDQEKSPFSPQMDAANEPRDAVSLRIEAARKHLLDLQDSILPSSFSGESETQQANSGILRALYLAQDHYARAVARRAPKAMPRL